MNEGFRVTASLISHLLLLSAKKKCPCIKKRDHVVKINNTVVYSPVLAYLNINLTVIH